MKLQVGDYARIQLHKDDLSDPDEFIYGTIQSFTCNDLVVNVELHVPFYGVRSAAAMACNVVKLTEPEYVLAVMMSDTRDEQTDMKFDNMKCDHNWIPSGRSFLTDKVWYDCKICGEQKGG